MYIALKRVYRKISRTILSSRAPSSGARLDKCIYEAANSFFKRGILARIPFHTWRRQPLPPVFRSPSVAKFGAMFQILSPKLYVCLAVCSWPSGRWHAVSNANRMPRSHPSYIRYPPPPPLPVWPALRPLCPSVFYPAGQRTTTFIL